MCDRIRKIREDVEWDDSSEEECEDEGMPSMFTEPPEMQEKDIELTREAVLGFLNDQQHLDNRMFDQLLEKYIWMKEEELEFTDDCFQEKQLKQLISTAEDLRIRVLALMAYQAQFEEKVSSTDTNLDIDPDDLPF
ncbi:MAG: hypothetical protein K6A68_07550 [Clostridiales bacterium]|nr:hypothetical protein [Clostridiales bacterium]